MNEAMHAVLSEWMRLTLRLRLFVSGGLFMTSWETFMGCDCVKGGKEYLRLDECGLKMMSGG